MKEHGHKIASETDPILREIWAAGYTEIVESMPDWTLTLYKDKGKGKVIDISEFRQLCCTLNIKQGLMPDGTIHKWVSEADGSAERLRHFIS